MIKNLRTSLFEFRILGTLALALICGSPTAALADSSALILRGVAGTPQHAERFTQWTDETRSVLVDKFGFAADRVIVLADRETQRDRVRQAFDQLKNQMQPLDSLFVFFIGHGTFDTDYKFNISGPDLTSAEYNELLSGLSAARIVIVNATNSSGGSIENLAAPNRVIVTATRSGQEGNDALFYGHFLEGLKNAAADEDKDQKVSVWEAFKYATESLTRFYKEEGRLATEHPQISANGAEKTGEVAEAPPLARAITFHVDKAVTVSDPRLQGLLDERREIEQRLEFLRLAKDSMPEAEYESKLEDLLIELALKNQQIREQERKP